MSPVNETIKRAPSPRRHKWLVGGVAFAYGALLGLGVFLLPHDAMALRVTMKRIVFEGTKRSDLVILINNTNDEMAYRLGWRRMRMTEDKSLVPVPADDAAPDLRSADEMIKYSPRRIVMRPGESQQVRLMLRRPKDLPDGEYRSHFWIEPEAASVKFDPSEIKGDPTKGPAVQIKMLTGITLPVIVRAGDLSAKGSITNVRATRAGSGIKVKLTLNREGNRSLYGDFDFKCAGQLAYQVRGIAVYTEVAKRNLDFDIKAPPAGCNTLDITYTATEDDLQFKGGVIASASAPVQ